MTQRFHVTMLGQFEIWEVHPQGEDVTRRLLPLPATSRSQSLLAYLLLHRDTPQSRDILAEMFWPRRPPNRARRSLSTELWRIRHCFAPHDPLQSDRQFVQMSLPSEALLDVESFEAVLKEARGVEALQKAINLYGGEFLRGFYDDWVIDRRYWFQSLYQDALLKLMQQYESLGEDQSALRAALQVLELDPYSEAAHRAAMRAYWRLGQYSASLEQYHRCKETLAEGLKSEPSAETARLYREILTRERIEGKGSSLDLTTLPVKTSPHLAHYTSTEDTPPLVGRGAEMSRLQAIWARAVGGRGGMVFLRGEAGIGKTRLLMTLNEYVQHHGGLVVPALSYEYEREDVYGALVDVMRSALAAGGEPFIKEMSLWQVASLVHLAPEVKRYLPARDRDIASHEAEQKHLLNALAHLLILLARRSPLLLLMDDLQWAQESTLAWLSTLARRIATEPLLLVASYRIEEVSPGDLLAKLVARLETEKRAEALTLSRLSQGNLAAWLQGIDADHIAQLHHHTEGNPFFVLETLRSLLDQGRLLQEGDMYRVRDEQLALSLPETVRQAVQMRLDVLSPTTRQGLAVAAVIGRVFDLDVWMQVWGQNEETALETLDELLRRRLLREGEGAFARDYEFDHHLVQETVYQGTPRRRRKQLHITTARTLEALRGGDPGLSAEIAFHYLRAQEPQLARPWLLQAGDHAVAVAATAEALGYYKRALAGYPDDATHVFERAVLERKIGEVFFRRGEYEEAEPHLFHALHLLGSPLPDPGWPMYRALAAALARQLAHRLNPWPARPSETKATPAIREEVAIYTLLGWMYSLQSRHADYLLVVLQALNNSEATNYARGVAVAATALGFAADFSAQFGLAEHFHRQAQAVTGGVANPTDAGFVAFGLAYHAYLTGNEGTMLEQATLAAEKYRQVGDAHRWTLTMALQAYVFAYRGQLDEVGRIAKELVNAGEAMQDTEAACIGESLFGLAGRWQGVWEEAAAHYQRAVVLAEQIPDYMSLVENLAGLARCQVRLGHWSQAREALEAAEKAMTMHDVKGDALGKYRVSAFETALWAAEHPPDSQSEWLAQAQRVMAAAQRQTRAFRSAEPEVWRLCGHYEWLCGHPDAARTWWEKSLAVAEAMDHRVDWGMTALEMGIRLGDPALREQGQARLEETGAVGEMAFLRS